jgi:transcriptional regulator with XRE-family HTH domain
VKKSLTRREVGSVIRMIGRRVRLVRKARGISSGKLGAAIGVSLAQVCKIERGEHCRAAVLLKIAKVLDVSPLVFFMRDHEIRAMARKKPGTIKGLSVILPQRRRTK